MYFVCIFGVFDKKLGKESKSFSKNRKSLEKNQKVCQQNEKFRKKQKVGKKKKKGTLSAGVEGELSLPPVVPVVNGVAFPKNR